MNFLKLICTASLALATISIAHAQSLDDIRAKGALSCGTIPGTPNLTNTDGFDAQFCRAIATAITGAPNVTIVNTTSSANFSDLRAGAFDVLLHAPHDTLAEATHKATHVATTYFDGIMAMAPKDLGVFSVGELDGAVACTLRDAPSDAASGYAQHRWDMTMTGSTHGDYASMAKEYAAGGCDLIIADSAALSTLRATLPDPSAHTFLPEVLLTMPTGLAIRDEDTELARAARLVMDLLILADEHRVYAHSLPQADNNIDHGGDVLLLHLDEAGQAAGLSATWMHDVLNATGNYGEIFDRHIGADAPAQISRGLNASFINGGLMTAAH